MSERAFDFLHQPSLGRGWLENRAAILSLRLALALVTTAALVSAEAPAPGPSLALAALFLASQIWLARQPPERFGDPRLQTGLVVGDLLVITSAAVLTDGTRGQFFLSYFVLLLVVSLSGTFQRVTVVTTGACVAYALALVVGHDANEPWSSALWIHVPLLFGTGTFFGLVAQSSRDEHQALTASEHQRRALETVLAVTERLDPDLDVDEIVRAVSEQLATLVPRARLLRTLYQPNAGLRPAEILTTACENAECDDDATAPGETLACVAMVRRGEIVGTMVISADPPLDAGELAAARLLANSAAHALANAHLYQREHHAAERFQRLEAEHRRLFESADDWIAVYRRDGTIEAWNRGAERISGVPRSAAIGSRVDRFFAPGHDAAAFLDELGRGAPRSGVETIRVRCDGTRRFLVSTISPISTDGSGDARLLEIAKDLTDQREIRARLDQAEKLTAMGSFVSAVAHELNNPLTAVLLCARALERNPAGSPERLDILVSEAERASRIVAELLTYARPAHEDHTDVEPVMVIERAVRAFRAARAKETPEIVMDLAAELGSIRGSAREIEQALLNLLRNASQAMRGEGQIRIVARRDARDQTLTIDVEDDGPGVSAGIRARIFEPFFTTKAPGEGTGLGLPLVQRVMTSHGGRVEVLDHAGGGAVFRLRFPATAGAPTRLFARAPREMPLA